MIVSMWMTRDPLTMTPDVTITRAAEVMSQRKIRRIPVVEDDSARPRLLGIVSSTDILHAYSPDVNPFGILPAETRGHVRTVGEIMTARPLTTTPEAPIEEVARVLRDKKIGALPVVRGEQVVGIITESDIFRAFLGLMGADKGGVRITFDLTSGDDAIALVTTLARRHGLRLASVMTTSYERQELAVVRVHGHATQAFTDELWSSGYRVLNVLNCDVPGPSPKK